jgi:cell division protein FtsI/penicillin-binding protein 2
MLDTRGVRASNFMAIVAVTLAGACTCQPQSGPTMSWTSAVAHTAQLVPQARILVLDIATGRLLAANHLSEAARTLAAPGSTLKPLALYNLIASGRWDPTRRIACTRKLRIAGRSLNCSHPAADPMDARQALAWSCNTYFATVAGTLASGDLRSLLAPTGLLGQTGLASAEAVAAFRDPRTPDESSLTLLGVDGIRITPLELASAYRWLALQLDAHSNTAASQVIWAGLTDSASFGMAGPASLGGVPVAGKTGTANLGPGTPSHGWFVGLAPSVKPRVVIVVYLPSGRGADAAKFAAALLAHSSLRQARP